jgi:hypothetical protein
MSDEMEDQDPYPEPTPEQIAECAAKGEDLLFATPTAEELAWLDRHKQRSPDGADDER